MRGKVSTLPDRSRHGRARTRRAPRRLAAGIAAAALLAASAAVAEPSAPDGVPDSGARCDDWGSFDRGSFLIENDVWNRGELRGYEQCIFGGTQPGAPFGWRWRWPAGTGQVRAFPSVIHGFSPWRETSTASRLPLRVAELRPVTAHFASTTHATGTGNLAFDLWLKRSRRPGSAAITNEVMIWLERRGQALRGRRMPDVHIRGAGYELWADRLPAWGYLAFVAKAPMPAGTLRLDSFLRYLAHAGWIQADEQLASIELGSEIVDGAGETRFSRYELVFD